jgi:uncharacterized membrane protein YvlD (DUF360 family)
VVVDAVAEAITIGPLPGVSVTGAASGIIAAEAALLPVVIEFYLRLIIVLLALPLGFFVTFGVGFTVNVIQRRQIRRIHARCLPLVRTNSSMWSNLARVDACPRFCDMDSRPTPSSMQAPRIGLTQIVQIFRQRHA